jgi:TusA-related sulfurtransferase
MPNKPASAREHIYTADEIKKFFARPQKKGTPRVSLPETRLDITQENCPMTFVRTKLCLERLAPGAVLRVRLREGEPLINVPRAVEDHGHEILSIEPQGEGVFELVIRRS